MGDIPLGCWINRYLQLIEAGIQGVDPLPLPYAAPCSPLSPPVLFLFPPPLCVATLRGQSWRGSDGAAGMGRNVRAWYERLKQRPAYVQHIASLTLE